MTNTDQPHDPAAEQAVLGSCLLDASVFDRLRDILAPGDFYLPAHVHLWDAIIERHRAGEPVDPITLAAHLAGTGDLTRIGGAPYLHTLMSAVPTTANATYYARIVADHARRRQVIALGRELAQVAIVGDDTARVVARGRNMLADLPEPTWPEPMPLTRRRVTPTFPVDALPGWVAGMVNTVAGFTQTPVDLAASVALAALSTAAGGKTIFQVRQGWHEPANLFLVCVLPPGSRKSAVFAALIRPLLEVEKTLIERTEPLRIEATITAKVARQRSERAANAAANATDPAQHANLLAEATSAEMEAEAIAIPVEPQLIADDVTSEEAASLLAAQGGRIAVLSPEGGIFATIAGRYSGAPNLEVFLKGHAGDLLRVNRKSRAREFVERPTLTLGLAVQPEVLRDIAQMPGFRGKGLLARILFSVPENTVGFRTPGAHLLDQRAVEDFTKELTTVALSLADLPEVATLALTAEADKRVLALEWEVEPRLAPSGEWGHVADWGSKWVGAIVRIAGLLHLADHVRDGWGQPIGASTIDRAAAIGRYFAEHTLAAFDDMGVDPDVDDARVILAWIERTATARFTKRDLFSALPRGRFKKTGDLDRPLSLLMAHGYLRAEPQPERVGRGRPPSPAWLAHPEVVNPVAPVTPVTIGRAS